MQILISCIAYDCRPKWSNDRNIGPCAPHPRPWTPCTMGVLVAAGVPLGGVVSWGVVLLKLEHVVGYQNPFLLAFPFIIMNNEHRKINDWRTCSQKMKSNSSWINFLAPINLLLLITSIIDVTVIGWVKKYKKIKNYLNIFKNILLIF